MQGQTLQLIFVIKADTHARL